MSPKRREVHFGVFVLGTGSRSAGWPDDGAATSNNDPSVIQEIAWACRAWQVRYPGKNRLTGHCPRCIWEPAKRAVEKGRVCLFAPLNCVQA